MCVFSKPSGDYVFLASAVIFERFLVNLSSILDAILRNFASQRASKIDENSSGFSMVFLNPLFVSFSPIFDQKTKHFGAQKSLRKRSRCDFLKFVN